jgi:hypothetical protein
MSGVLTVTWVAIVGLIATTCAFAIGFMASTRINQRRIDEMIVIIKRPSTFSTHASV